MMQRQEQGCSFILFFLCKILFLTQQLFDENKVLYFFFHNWSRIMILFLLSKKSTTKW